MSDDEINDKVAASWIQQASEPPVCAHLNCAVMNRAAA
jgi:5,10-methylenetetrahydrofolate reductase